MNKQENSGALAWGGALLGLCIIAFVSAIFFGNGALSQCPATSSKFDCHTNW